MSWQNILFDFILAIVFIILLAVYGYFEKRDFSINGIAYSVNSNDNFLISAVLPALFLIFTSLILVSTNKYWLLSGIWITSLFILIIRLVIMIVTNYVHAINLVDWLVSGVIAVLLSFTVNKVIIYSKSALHFSTYNAAAIIWSTATLLLGIFIFRLTDKRFTDEVSKLKLIKHMYLNNYREYSDILSTNFKKDPLMNRAFFSILITEDLNRPWVFRFFERLAFPLGIIKTTGIMQVNSKHKLTDKQSVKLAENLIRNYSIHAKKEFKSEYMQIRKVASEYNDGSLYIDLVVEVYFVLVELDIKKLSTLGF